MKLVQKLMAKNKPELEYDDTIGWLTKEDLIKLRKARTKQASPHRKTTYKTWDCSSCNSRFFYSIMRCPACESGSITENVNKSDYHMVEI